MPNFPGAIARPLLTNPSAYVDAGPITKVREVSIARGGTAADYNVKLRGLEQRIDRKPKRPYP